MTDSVIGLRFVIEAIAGGNFAKDLPAAWILACQNSGKSQAPFKVNQLTARFVELEMRLQSKRPTLIGHNQLFDLCFIHNTFFGSLPDELDEFKDNMQHFFPQLVDTKYMVTRGTHVMEADESLSELFDRLQEEQAMPLVCAANAKLGYRVGTQALHEAGYDSEYL